MNIYIHPIVLYIVIVPVATLIWYVTIFAVYIFAHSQWLAKAVNSQKIWDIIRAAMTALVVISPLMIVLITLLMYKIFGLL